MTSVTPAGWYPDPELPGGQRYFDGVAWTEHRVGPAPSPPPTFDWWGRPAWKGAHLGRPQFGPGSLANPGRRLGARALDFLLLLPVFGLLLGVSLAVAAPHFGPIFPNYPQYNTGGNPPPGILWVYLDVLACGVATGLVLVAYETYTTIRYGRSVGKAWMHIRPLRTNGALLNPGRAFGRVALYWVSMFFGWIGFLDPAWCLWDPVHQCLHDKMVDTIVVNDGTPADGPGPGPMTARSWGTPGTPWPSAPGPYAPGAQPQWYAPQWPQPQGPPPQWSQPQWSQPQWSQPQWSQPQWPAPPPWHESQGSQPPPTPPDAPPVPPAAEPPPAHDEPPAGDPA